MEKEEIREKMIKGVNYLVEEGRAEMGEDQSVEDIVDLLMENEGLEESEKMITNFLESEEIEED